MIMPTSTGAGGIPDWTPLAGPVAIRSTQTTATGSRSPHVMSSPTARSTISRLRVSMTTPTPWCRTGRSLPTDRQASCSSAIMCAGNGWAATTRGSATAMSATGPGRRSTQYLAKGNLESQIHPSHQVRTGFEVKSHEIFRHRIGMPTLPNLEFFTYKPMEVAVYLQDKVEYSFMILKAGVRVDYFDPRATEYPDPAQIIRVLTDATGTAEYKYDRQGPGQGPRADQPAYRYRASDLGPYIGTFRVRTLLPDPAFL